MSGALASAKQGITGISTSDNEILCGYTVPQKILEPT